MLAIKIVLSMPNEKNHIFRRERMEVLLEEGFSRETISVLEEAGYDMDASLY